MAAPHTQNTFASSMNLVAVKSASRSASLPGSAVSRGAQIRPIRPSFVAVLIRALSALAA